jgi:DNA-binding MarR family transcriptional regulator
MHKTNNIGYLIQHLATSLARQTDQVLQDEVGISFSQFKILMVLQHHPHLQQKQIAERLTQTEASISRQIKGLEDEGLVQITVNPENRREHRMTPTTKGIQRAEQAREELNKHFSPMFNQLTDHQQQELLNTLSTMHEYACQSSTWCQVNN